MRFVNFQQVMSVERTGRYLYAAKKDTRRAMTLYRLNLRASQELFTIISFFEIALRNAIDRHYSHIWGNHWLRDSALEGGVLCDLKCGKTPDVINAAMLTLNRNYSHAGLVAKLDFGFWRYMFARHQYAAFGKTLLAIFPGKPVSSPGNKYDNSYLFSQLEKINKLRNRIAHHEPICFLSGAATCCTAYARQHYQLILDLFSWLGIDASALLYGLDHVPATLDQIDYINKKIRPAFSHLRQGGED